MPHFLIFLIGVLLIVGIGIIDANLGVEVTFSLFYIMPIALMAWVLGRRAGVLASLACAMAGYWGDVPVLYNPLIPFWNSIFRFVLFLVITLLLTSLKKALLREREQAHTDFLTSAINVRYFHEIARLELDHLQRYQRPFTIAYLDIDNFKMINDRYGHNIGDHVLRSVVKTMKSHLRKSDIIARIGGDEFVVLLPETDQDAAGHAFRKIQDFLKQEMQQYGFPITFSIGVLTCLQAPESTEEMIRAADELMYSAKAAGKNTICSNVYNGTTVNCQ